MNNQSPNNNDQPEPKSWREERWERRQARRAAYGNSGRGGTLIAGLLLVILGAAFLLQNAGYFIIPLKNWGALFILIPAFGSFSRAVWIYRAEGNQLTVRARGAFFLGIMLVIITAVILFDLNWLIWGPVLIILVGLGLLLNSILSPKKE